MVMVVLFSQQPNFPKRDQYGKQHIIYLEFFGKFGHLNSIYLNIVCMCVDTNQTSQLLSVHLPLCMLLSLKNVCLFESRK